MRTIDKIYASCTWRTASVRMRSSGLEGGRLGAADEAATFAGGANTDSNHLDLVAGLWFCGRRVGCILKKDNLAACGHQLNDLLALGIRLMLRIGIAVARLVFQASGAVQATSNWCLELLIAVQAALLFVVIEEQLEKLIARNELTLPAR